MASGDRFVFFKVGGDRRDDNFFFYRVFPFLARPLDSVGDRIDRMEWQTDEPMQLSYQNGVHTLFFLVVQEIHLKMPLLSLGAFLLDLMSSLSRSSWDASACNAAAQMMSKK